jgi:hypothetical protein
MAKATRTVRVKQLLVQVESADASTGLKVFNTLLAMARDSAAEGRPLEAKVHGVRGVTAHAKVEIERSGRSTRQEKL